MQGLTREADNSFNRRRIALFEPYPDLVTNPTLVCLLQALTRHGSRVDVMMHHTGSLSSVNSNIAVYRFPEGLSLWYGDVRTTCRCWSERLSIERLRIEQRFAAGAYDLILGIDSLGIIRGSKYAKRYNVPLVYLSFEMFFRDELIVDSEIEEKEQEIKATQMADLVVVQDAHRGRLLAEENGLVLDKFAYLPVSPSGSRQVKRSNYLRDRFHLSEEQTIVLQSGTFADWTYADELLKSLDAWPEGFVLVIHSRDRLNDTSRYVREIKAADLPNIILSTEPLPADEYEQLVGSADMGLVMYKATPPSRYLQKNIEYIGLASGKFSFYMKYGIPVISVADRTYQGLLEYYNFGENIDSFDELPDALIRVRSSENHHRAEAQRLFRERLDFDVYWPTLSARLLEIMK